MLEIDKCDEEKQSRVMGQRDIKHSVLERTAEKFSLRRCHLDKDLNEVRISHEDIQGKSDSDKGNCKGKGPDIEVA